MGLIVIIIIITPIFSLFDRKVDINSLVSDYMVKYDNKSIQNTKKTNGEYNPDTINIFKENLKNEIEKNIYDNLKKNYKITRLEIIEDQKSPQFLKVVSIKLKTVLNENKIEVVSKITIKSSDINKKYFWDKDVASSLQMKFDINPSSIKFIK